MTRLFVSLEIPEPVKDSIYFQLRKMTPVFDNYRWEQKHKIHLTLKFMGSVKEELVSEIGSSLNFISEFESFKCETGNFNYFYRNKKPSIFYLDFSSDKNIGELARKIDRELVKFDIPSEEKDFKIHLTLLRIKGGEDLAPLEFIKSQGIPKQEFIADEAALYKSKLQPYGSVYTKVKSYKLLRSAKDE